MPGRFDRKVGVLFAASVLLLFVAIGGAVVLPVSDAEVEAAPAALEKEARDGMRVYRSEGCWYCHTQQVRPVRTDAGLGQPRPANEYTEDDRPALLGAERIGPDLTHVGSRITSKDAFVKLLRDPRARDSHSSMPSYTYLSAKELDALAAYLLSLK